MTENVITRLTGCVSANPIPKCKLLFEHVSKAVWGHTPFTNVLRHGLFSRLALVRAWPPFRLIGPCNWLALEYRRPCREARLRRLMSLRFWRFRAEFVVAHWWPPAQKLVRIDSDMPQGLQAGRCRDNADLALLARLVFEFPLQPKRRGDFASR